MSRQIQEALEQKPDRDVVEKWLSGVLFKLEEIHEDVRESSVIWRTSQARSMIHS